MLNPPRFRFSHTFLSVIVSIFLIAGVSVPDAAAVGNPAVRNQFGMVTIKCHVHEFGPGNNVIGYVVGNSDSSPEDAEKEADMWVSKFNTAAAKRHCYAQSHYLASGAYNTNMELIP